ncbi:hypothetical protein ALP10_200256 [Pseudomonas syringae pv. helianthi]|nr:hypothetical protein ALP10_200256 [Pseudomonas syringae pv. helianthi]
MTYEHMSADRKHRLQWLGGLADQWSPQQRAHWLAEQALNWSDLPAVHVRPTIFVENPLLTWFPLENMYKKGELCLPFGSACISPIAAKDVADVCANILISPKAHIGKSYALTGPESLSMNQIAAEFSRVLERKVAYVSLSIDHSDNMIDTILAKRSVHTAEHLKVLTRLIAGGRYEVVTDVLEKLLGRMPTSFGEAMAANSTVNKFIDDKK